MKKVFYSIAIVSAMMFASCSEDRGTTHEVADANLDGDVNPTHIRGYGDDLTEQDAEAIWVKNSERVSGRMATDMKLDPDTKNKVQQVLYQHEKRLNELEGNYNYSETNRMGGVAEDVDNMATVNKDRAENNGGTTNMRTNTADINAEREIIIADTDRELKAILTPEQYTMYQQNRANYDEMKYKNDATDTKLKVEGDETKYKSGDTKIKRDGDEMKIKTETEKIKVEKKN
ncbi:hypothetical protein H9Q13_05780 [Pontibacter sp. JH31]|uniref:Lipoprotein n=1 Tax=Pontibacter aquaedesilientis TaxID=2766980 RepID=A0ABR7XEF2_9BACT|nr:hypothetical protein [Pontibacter aquaedesilientis]MBD1396669.1 hypothetical protein [Pontibacter aquaedesilientis]